VNVPAKVPCPSALVNVPVTVEVMLPGEAAGADAMAALPAWAVAALAAVAVRPVARAATTAGTARMRRLGDFMIYLSIDIVWIIER
jgi:hypothetical protein